LYFGKNARTYSLNLAKIWLIFSKRIPLHESCIGFFFWLPECQFSPIFFLKLKKKLIKHWLTWELELNEKVFSVHHHPSFILHTLALVLKVGVKHQLGSTTIFNVNLSNAPHLKVICSQKQSNLKYPLSG